MQHTAGQSSGKLTPPCYFLCSWLNFNQVTPAEIVACQIEWVVFVVSRKWNNFRKENVSFTTKKILLYKEMTLMITLCYMNKTKNLEITKVNWKPKYTELIHAILFLCRLWNVNDDEISNVSQKLCKTQKLMYDKQCFLSRIRQGISRQYLGTCKLNQSVWFTY